QVHEEGAVADLVDGDALDRVQGVDDRLGVGGVAGRAGDVDAQSPVPGGVHVERGDGASHVLDGVGEAAHGAGTSVDLQADRDRVGDAGKAGHGKLLVVSR